MIIKRRVTRAYVSLENSLVRDRRLSLDEHGMLHYLLSLPDDWEVSRAQCARYWNVGRDRIARIFASLQRTGWAQLERVQATDGTFVGVRWIIGDTPGPEVPEGEIVESEDASEEPVAATSDEATEPATKMNHDTPNPSHGSAVARVSRHTADPYHGQKKEEDTNTEEQQTPPLSPPLATEGAKPQAPPGGEAAGPAMEARTPTWAEFVAKWPPDQINSPFAAEKAWLRLPDAVKRAALDGVQPYLADCRAKQRKVCDAKTYLSERRWERFSAAKSSASVLIKPFSPQWYRWREYRLATGQSVKFMDLRARDNALWSEPSEWPPPLTTAQRAATGPPALATEEDLDVLANSSLR